MSFKQSVKSKKFRFAGLAAFVVGAVLVATALFGLQRIAYWQKYGIPVQGYVLDKYVEVECQNKGVCLDSYYLAYSYISMHGAVFEGDDSISKDFWDAQDKGSEILLLYSSIRPSMSSISYALGSDTQKLLWVITLGLSGALTLTGVVLLFKSMTRQAESLASINKY